MKNKPFLDTSSLATSYSLLSSMLYAFHLLTTLLCACKSSNFLLPLNSPLATRLSSLAIGYSPLASLLYSFQLLTTLHANQVIPSTPLLATRHSLFVTRQSLLCFTRSIYSQFYKLPVELSNSRHPLYSCIPTVYSLLGSRNSQLGARNSPLATRYSTVLIVLSQLITRCIYHTRYFYLKT